MHDAALDRILVDTALRETREEVGVNSEDIDAICSLPPFLSGWLHTTTVTPVAALLRGNIDDLVIRENREEVEDTLWVPLQHFIVGDYHRQLRGGWRGLHSSISSFHLPPLVPGGPPQIVWGLTAAICTAVSSVALGELPHYPAYCEAILKIDETHVHASPLAPRSHIHRTLHKSKL